MLRFLQTETFLFPFRLFFGKVPEESELLPMKKSSKLMKDGVTVCQLEDELFSKVEQIDDTELEEIISIDEI